MTRMAWVRIALGGCLLLGVLAGCASGGPSTAASGGPSSTQSGQTPGSDGTPHATPAPTATTAPTDTFSVTLRRTGGFAGVDQSIVIGPDGSWTYTEGRGGRGQTGRFTDAQQADLARLVLDPRLVQELTPRSDGTVCNDGFTYMVTLGTLGGSAEDCGDLPPALQGIITYVSNATPF